MATQTFELVFVGIAGSVVALNRATGEQLWTRHLKGSGFTNVVLDGGRLFATASGELFCLDPQTGNLMWHNRLKGYGTGLATVAASDERQTLGVTAAAEKLRRDQAAAAASAAT